MAARRKPAAQVRRGPMTGASFCSPSSGCLGLLKDVTRYSRQFVASEHTTDLAVDLDVPFHQQRCLRRTEPAPDIDQRCGRCDPPAINNAALQVVPIKVAVVLLYDK